VEPVGVRGRTRRRAVLPVVAVEVRGELGEHETLLSVAKARRLLGYEPQHSGGTT
jgi:hypothetical protein